MRHCACKANGGMKRDKEKKGEERERESERASEREREREKKEQERDFFQSFILISCPLCFAQICRFHFSSIFLFTNCALIVQLFIVIVYRRKFAFTVRVNSLR